FRARVRRRHLECDDRGRPPRRGRGLFHRRRGRPLRPDADRALASRVDASRIVVNGGAHTGLYFVTHGPDGHSFSYLRAGSAASRIAETDLPVDRIRETKILHVSGISQAISSSAADAVFAAIDIAHGANRLVSYDPNLRLKLWPLRRARAVIHEAMRSCDIALPGLDDAFALTAESDPDAIVDFYLRLG